MKVGILIGKVLTILLWAYGIAALLAPERVPYRTLALVVVGATLIAHVIEALIFAPKLQKLDGQSQAYHAANLLVFGVTHTLTVRSQHKTS